MRSPFSSHWPSLSSKDFAHQKTSPSILLWNIHGKNFLEIGKKPEKKDGNTQYFGPKDLPDRIGEIPQACYFFPDFSRNHGWALRTIDPKIDPKNPTGFLVLKKGKVRSKDYESLEDAWNDKALLRLTYNRVAILLTSLPSTPGMGYLTMESLFDHLLVAGYRVNIRYMSSEDDFKDDDWSDLLDRCYDSEEYDVTEYTLERRPKSGMVRSSLHCFPFRLFILFYREIDFRSRTQSDEQCRLVRVPRSHW